MAATVASFLPFPNICWWACVPAGLLLDGHEHFEKMSYRNRYYIGGANGRIALSIPVQQGRHQRSPMREVRISYAERWQVQHWRTLTSVYGRSPFFEHYAHTLQPLFEERFELLADFNLASIQWLQQQLGIVTDIVTETDSYQKQYEGWLDIRSIRPAKDQRNEQGLFPQYYQVFADRTGFLPNLSLLDLLCSEGPQAAQWLAVHRRVLQGYLLQAV